MQSARQQLKIAIVLATVSCLAVAVFSPSEVMAAAGGIQSCTEGATCTIGEFLYDDSSAPIAGAACAITSKYPDHTSFLSSQAMSGGGADGWYYYEFTTPATGGMYSTQVSCTVSGDTLSIDKSFEAIAAVAAAPSTSSIASAVWAYSGKTLDSFGTLPADVWSYSTRTVSSFGTLIADIWASATRTLTGASLSTGQLATQSDVVSVRDKIDTLTASGGDLSEIKKNTNESRLLIEKVVNAPIIQNVLEESAQPVVEKLNDTRATANQIYVNNQFLTAQSAVLASNWNSLTGKEALDGVLAIADVIGETGDPSSSKTMFGEINWIRDSWSWSEGDVVYGELTSSAKIIADLKSGLANYQKSPNLYAKVKLLVRSSLALEKMVGTTADIGSANTLFAKIKSTGDLALSFDEKEKQVDNVLGAYTKSKDASAISSQILDLTNQIIALNKIPGATSAITKIVSGSPNSITNNLLSLRGIITSNKKLLSLGAGKAMVNVWLEVGSIIFKTVATNPSTLISQKVDIKYYLPKEIKKDDIVKTDAGLDVQYDSEKDQLFVEGTFTLAAGATRTFSVETKDIWNITPTEIQSVRDQADALFKPLERTAYYAQGVSLRSDINAAMDQVNVLQAGAVTPEDKIKAYRQADILRNSADTKLTGMKELVTQASAAGNLFGFVGGSQTIAVWGLVVIIAAAFVFMTIYMRTLIGKAKAEVGETAKKHAVGRGGIHPLRFVAVMVASSLISAGVTGYVVNQTVSKNFEAKLAVLGEKAQVPSVPVVAPAPVLNDVGPVLGTGTGGQYLVVVGDTPTGYLRVRKTPGGAEIAKVNVGDKLPFLDEQDGWFKIQLEDGKEGWVSGQYSTKE